MIRASLESCALALGLALAGCSADLSFESGSSSSTTSDTASSGDTTSGSGASGGDGGSDGGGDVASPSSTGSSNDGGGGASSSPSSTGVTVSSSTGPGADCRTAAECVDANPCTIDTCGDDGTCQFVGVAPGEAGNAGEGSCPSGVCQTDQTCGLRVFSRAYVEAGATWTTTTLSEVWGGQPNAPPFRGIREIVPIPAQDALVVFVDDEGENVAHVRVGDEWLDPLPASSYLPGLPTDIRCGYAYRASSASLATTLLLSGPGGGLQQAFIYTIEEDGSATADPGNPYPVDRTDEGTGAPPNDQLCRWAFSRQTGFLGDPSWVVAWEGTGPNVYLYDGGSTSWTDYGADVTSPIWNAAGTAPASQSVVAAWLESETLHLVAP